MTKVLLFASCLGVYLALTMTTASAAQADTVGSLTFGPAAGQDITPMSAFTSGLCPGGTNLQMKVFGKGFKAVGANVTGNTSQSIYPRMQTGGFEVPLQNTMRAFADEQSPPAVLSGEYSFVVVCRAKLSAQTFGEFAGVLTFVSPTRYVSGGSAAATASASSRPAPTLDSPSAVGPAPDPSVSAPSALPSAQPVAVHKKTNSGPGLVVVAVVLAIAVAAVAIALRRSGRKQAFIRP